MGFWDSVKRFLELEKQPDTSNSSNDGQWNSSFDEPSGEPDPFDLYYEAYLKAEELRKQGRGTEAKPVYEEAIEHVEAAPDWGLDGLVPPAPYRQYAKMLYHMGLDEEAVEVLDRYIEMNVKRNEGFEELRERIATGDFRRLRNKYS